MGLLLSCRPSATHESPSASGLGLGSCTALSEPGPSRPFPSAQPGQVQPLPVAEGALEGGGLGCQSKHGELVPCTLPWCCRPAPSPAQPLLSRRPAPGTARTGRSGSRPGQSLEASPQQPLRSVWEQPGQPWEFPVPLSTPPLRLRSALFWVAAGPRVPQAPVSVRTVQLAFPCLLWLQRWLGWGTPSPRAVKRLALSARALQGAEATGRACDGACPLQGGCPVHTPTWQRAQVAAWVVLGPQTTAPSLGHQGVLGPERGCSQGCPPLWVAVLPMLGLAAFPVRLPPGQLAVGRESPVRHGPGCSRDSRPTGPAGLPLGGGRGLD